MTETEVEAADPNQALLAEALAGLAKDIGLDDLSPDESGYCALVGEGERIVHLQREGDELLLVTELGQLPADQSRLGVLEALLAANAFWEHTRGATISCELTSDRAILARRIPLAPVARDQLYAVLETFLYAADECRQHLEPAGDDKRHLPPDQAV